MAVSLFIASAGVFSTADAAEFSENQARSLMNQYCVDCHGVKEANGEVRLNNLKADFSDPATAAIWVEVRNQINIGDMPPFDEPQPDIEDIDALSKWIADGLREAERTALANDGRVLMRRLNRAEYTHTLEDLLFTRFALEESPEDRLPPDGKAEGFTKVSAALLVDPSLMRQYYEVAREVVDKVIVDGPPEFETQKRRFEFEDTPEHNVTNNTLNELGVEILDNGMQMVNSDVRLWNTLGYNDRGSSPTPIPGFYRFTLRALSAQGKDGAWPRIRVFQSHPNEDQQILFEREIRPDDGSDGVYTVEVPRDDKGGEIKVEVVDGPQLSRGFTPGIHFRNRNRDLAGRDSNVESGRKARNNAAEIIRLRGRQIAEGWAGGGNIADPEKMDYTQFPRVLLDWIEVEGPLYESWPPRFQQEYLGENSAELTSRVEQESRAREALANFLPRAFRRPVEPAEIENFLGIIKDELDHGQSFHEAMRVGIAAVLTSPKFLFINEPNPNPQPRDLNDFEIASRLSYFLWSSMPDEELFDLAAQGKLGRPQVLMKQVERMLDDVKHERFVNNFGKEWLKTETFLAFDPNRRLFEEYDERLGKSAVREPLEFFKFIIARDLPLLNFIKSDFLVVNDRLAEHYGLDNVRGPEFRPVRLPKDTKRGGLLAMAGVHLAGSDGQRTKPVSRAVYVREVLFNDPPDPPPPNAGEVEPNIKGEKLTVAQRLMAHQELPSCAACHQRLDPYGIALENFNVIGQWREREDGEGFNRPGPHNPEIDPSGRLPNGQEFETWQQYRELLVDQSDRFRKGLAEKMLTYALGRPVRPADSTEVDRIVKVMEQNNDTFEVLVKATVSSNIFRTK